MEEDNLKKYEDVPKSIGEEIIKQYGGKSEE